MLSGRDLSFSLTRTPQGLEQKVLGNVCGMKLANMPTGDGTSQAAVGLTVPRDSVDGVSRDASVTL